MFETHGYHDDCPRSAELKTADGRCPRGLDQKL